MKIALPDTLVARLTFWYTMIYMVFTAVAFLLFYLSIEAILERNLDNELREDVAEFQHIYQKKGRDELIAELRKEAGSNPPDETFFRLVDQSGNTLFVSDLSDWNSDLLPKESFLLSKETAFQTVKEAVDEYDARVITAPIDEGLMLQIGESELVKNEFLALLRKVFIAAFFPISIISGIAGWLVARKSMRGVIEITEAVKDVARGSLDRHVATKAAGREIDELADAFNIMVDRIRSLVTGIREMTDNIAHDLRSPLARIQAMAETVLSRPLSAREHKAAAADTMEECERLLRMINNTLDVTEVEMGAATIAMEKVDLSALVLDVCELFEPLAEERHIRLASAVIPGCHLTGNTQYLQRMLANLLDNALKFTPSAGEISVRLDVEDNAVVLCVADTGIGIEASDRERVFDRFYRCDQSRSAGGNGLGLSLVRAVIKAHRGDIELTSTLGKGSRFLLRFRA